MKKKKKKQTCVFGLSILKINDLLMYEFLYNYVKIINVLVLVQLRE